MYKLKRQKGLDRSFYEKTFIQTFYSKPISVLVPAYNEEAGILESIYSLLSLNYPQYEIIIINDGSTDATFDVVKEAFLFEKIEPAYEEQLTTKKVLSIYQSKMHPNLFIVNKENGGKADALNVGINFSRYPYFCSIDGDSILERQSLLRVMKPILRSSEEVIACGGNVRIVNDLQVDKGAIFSEGLPKNPLVLMQIIEYLRAFLLGRIALSHFNLILIISGAFSVFQKKHVLEVEGYSPNMIGEDMELVVKLQRYIQENKLNKRIEFVSDPVCFTEAPQSFEVLRKQRRRWHQGLISSLWKHRKMTFNPKYGKVGMISIPYFWIIECFGPIVELLGYLYVIVAFFLGKIYYEFAIVLLLLLIMFGTLLSILSVLFEAWSLEQYPKPKDLLKMIAIALTENIWFRPLTLLWRLEGIIHFLRGKHVWGNMQRDSSVRKGIR